MTDNSDATTGHPPREGSPQPGDASLDVSNVSFSADELLVFGAKQIISLFVPVTICMFFVVLIATTVEFYASTDTYLIYTPFHTPDADLGTRTWQTIANTLIFMSIIIVMTCVLVLLFKYRCYWFIQGWLVLTTFLVLFGLSILFFGELVSTMGIFVDYITMALIFWNFGVVGLVVIHWRGPLILRQAYLIFLSAQVALVFLKYLPRWTCWALLGVLAIWDLIAVLCPRGPLRMLVEMAQEREQPLFPALLYSTTAAYLVTDSTEADANSSAGEGSNSTAQVPLMAEYLQATGDQQTSSVPSTTDSATLGELRQRRARPLRETSVDLDGEPINTTRRWREIQADVRDREERGVKLGLGDFVFYSLLIGRAALDGDSITVATSYVAILVGMCVTIIVLGITRRALPALPISVACGLLFYFVTSTVISPFLEEIAVGRLIF